MRRMVAELPGSVDELALVRFGLVARRVSAWRYLRRLGSEVEREAAGAIRSGAGLLHSERFAIGWRHLGFLQYWAGFGALDAWSRRAPHADWWRGAVERMRSRGDLGVYHEAFVVPRDRVESIYLDCPPVGLSAFGTLAEPVGPRTTAAQRLGRPRG